MSHKRTLLWFILAALTTVAIPTRALGQSIQLHSWEDVELGDGIVDGKLAVAFFPQVSPTDSRLADPAGFRSVVFPDEDPWDKRTVEAGAWKLWDRGVYDFWIEGDGLIGRSPGRFVWEPGRPTALRNTGLPLQQSMALADRVVATAKPVPPEAVVHFFHFTSEEYLGPDPPREGVLLREFRRFETTEDAQRGVQLPAGDSIAAAWDQQSGEYWAISALGQSHDGSTELQLTPPEPGTSDVFLHVRRSEVASPGDSAHIYLLGAEGKSREPDALLRAAYRLRAVFYGVPSGSSVRVIVESPTDSLPPYGLPLRSGQVEFVSLRLAPRGWPRGPIEPQDDVSP